jgi:beta-lactamase regulating signal transducer with metallopeptidase domain
MTLISILLKASILLLAAALTNALFERHMSAASRHLLWALVVAGLLLLPILSFLLPPLTAFTAPAGSVLAPATLKQYLSSSTQETTGIREPFDTPVEQLRPRAIPSGIPWSGVLAAAYVIGAFALLVRLAAERLSIQKLVRRSTEVTDPEWQRLLQECSQRMDLGRTVRLLRSCEENMPMALGIWQRAIVIPAIADTWPEDRRRAVLLHETSHLIRHDCLSQMLAAAACALYWVHPGAWWIARRLRIERELACDDRVLSLGANAREYAGHLLELAYALRSGRTAALAVSMAGTGQLEGRMLAVLDAARNRAVPALRSYLAGLAILIVLLVPLSAATISGQQTKTGGVAATRDLVSRPTVSKAAPLPAVDGPGTWEIRPTDRARVVQLHLREGSSSYSTTVDLDHVNGLAGEFPKDGGAVQFTVQRDAGTFTVEGVVRSGVGAGTFTFTPSPTFPAELARRGLDRPTPSEQRILAGADIGFAFLDELAAQRYVRPAHVAELVRAAQHGVSLSYLREMGQSGYHEGNLDTLIDLANHGVSPEFIHELAAAGLSGLSTDDLRRARGFGVGGEYIRDLSSLGYSKLPLDTLVQLRHHGVDPGYVRDLGDLGYQNLSLDTLIQLRNHGVDADYARELGKVGYPKLPLDTLIELRNHGIDADYVRNLQSLGYTGLKVEELERLRSAGVSPDQIRSANSRAGRGLSIDNLVELAARGWR